jgi:catalase
MVHACGMGAFGYFEVTHDVSRYTKAKFLESVGKQTPVFARFSTVTYGREFPDSARNPRGFAVKFYTEEGNYDLVGLNFPIFFTRDPAMGPDVIRSQMRDGENFLLNFDAMFDFFINVPESLHCATMFFSNRGTPYGFRHMEGYGCHTFKWVNEAGKQSIQSMMMMISMMMMMSTTI